MKVYKVNVTRGEDGWLVAEGVNLRGLVTQGRDLDEVAVMVRDAIEALTESTEFTIQLVLPSDLGVRRKRAGKRATRRAA